MNVDNLLNLEKRTGVKNADIDDFTRKAADVQNAIRDMLDGKIEPEDVKIDGIDSPEETARKEKEKQERLIKRAKEAEELRVKRAAQEKEKWWAGAEMYRDNRDFEEASNLGVDELAAHQTAKDKIAGRYNFNYSKWDQWVPTDEASTAELEEAKAKEEAERNAEFEKNNPEFCNNFMSDMKEREKAKAKKQEGADVLRMKGNNMFKAKKFDEAVEYYMDALKVTPYDVKILTNIAQANIKLKNYDSALEFLSRTLYLDSRHVKALSRKAFILSERGQQAEADEAISLALSVEPANAELLALQKEIRIITKEALLEKLVTDDPAATSVVAGNASANEKTVESKDSLGDSVLTAPAFSEHTATGSSSGNSGESSGGSSHDVLSSEQSVRCAIEQLRAQLEARNASATALSQSPSHCEPQASSASPLTAAAACRGIAESHATVKKLLAYFRHSPRQADSHINNSNSSRSRGDKEGAAGSTAVATKMKMFARTSGALLEAVKLVQDLAGTLTTADPAANDKAILAKLSLTLCDVLALIALLCEQRAAQMVVVDAKLVSSVKSILASAAAPAEVAGGGAASASSSSPGSSNHVVLAGLKLLHCLSKEDICPKAQLQVLADKALLRQIGEVIGHKTFGLSTALAAESKNSKQTILSLLHTALSILKDSSFHDAGKSCLSASAGDAGSSVCAMGTALYQLVKCKALLKDVEELRGDCIEAAVAALLGCSQLEALRSFFTIEVRVDEPVAAAAAAATGVASAAKEVTASVVSAIVLLVKHRPIYASNGLAILMNACCIEANGGGGEGSVSEHNRLVVSESGCLAVLMKFLSLSDTERAAEDPSVLVRSAGLLSRIVTCPKVQRELIVDRNYRSVCRRLALVKPQTQGQDTSGRRQQASLEKWQMDERGHYVRILAALTLTTEKQVAIGLEEGIVAALLSLLPQPRTDAGVITSKSVILMPSEPITALLIGNVARCLMPYADQPGGAAVLYSDKKLVGVEKLICAMASCTDIRVRKNIAILLAKGCKIPAVREKVTELRGMQMIVELQHKF